MEVKHEQKVKFYSQFIKRNDIVFDIGANMGNRIEAFLKIGARVVAVEPQEKCVKFLKLRFGKKIKLIPKGVGAREEVKEFYISEDHTISSFSLEWIKSVQQSGRFSKSRWDRKNTVSITTLDNLIKEFGEPVFMKIDVEGYEPEVLKGLTTSVKALSFEYNTPEQNKQTLECLQILCDISMDFKSNYSVGETMKFELDEWLGYADMVEHIKTDAFQHTGFGDIYVLME